MDEHQQEDNSATTAALRREILQDYAAGDQRDKYVSQLDTLERRGIHRLERYPGQSPHIVVGDVLEREARKDRDEEERLVRDEVRRELQPERRRERAAGADLDRGIEREPQPSTAGWTKAYEVRRDEATGSVTYSRDGVERIRDDGRDVRVANDQHSIRDAVALVKEQRSGPIAVRATDPEKRAAIMRECVRQNQKVQVPTKAEEAEYHRACVAVAREQALAKRAECQQPGNEQAKGGAEICS